VEGVCIAPVPFMLVKMIRVQFTLACDECQDSGLFTEKIVIFFLNNLKVCVAVLPDVKQNLMHMCFSLKSAILWTGNLRGQDTQSHFIRHHFTGWNCGVKSE
jgi:hypothetical protein